MTKLVDVARRLGGINTGLDVDTYNDTGLNVAPETLRQGSLTNLQLQTPETPVSLDEQVTAAFDLNNVVASAANELLAAPRPPSENDFDYRQHLLPGEELVPSRFVDAGSLEDMQRIRDRVDREERAYHNLAKGPLNEYLATTLAVVLDPTTYLGPGALATTAKGLRAASTLGKAARIGGATAFDVALQESVFQGTQEMRSLEQSLAGILIGGAFGFGLGGAVGAVAARGARKAESFQRAIDDVVALGRHSFPESGQLLRASEAAYKIEDLLVARAAAEANGVAAEVARIDGEISQLEMAIDAVSPTAPVAAERTLSSAGAGPTAEATKLKSSFGVAEALAKLSKIGLAAPALELAASKFPAVRRLVHEMVDTGLVTKGMVDGLHVPNSLETLIRAHHAVTAEELRAVVQLQKAYKAAGGQMTMREFGEAVGQALRRGDTDAIPQVKEAAMRLRKTFDKYKDAATKLKLLPEGVKVEEAASYFSRVYDRPKIIARRTEFRGIVENYLRRQIPKEEVAADAEYAAMADDIVDSILGTPTGRANWAQPIQRGPMKGRTLHIPDIEIENFLRSDIFEVLPRYIRTMSADIEFARKFGRPDYFEKAVAEVQDDVRAAVDAAKTEAERTAAHNAGVRQQQVLLTLAHKLRGTYQAPMDPAYGPMRSVLRTLRTFNYVRSLGSVVYSSIPDVGRIAMEEGLGKLAGGLMSEMTSGFRGVEMALREAKAAGTALEMEMSQRTSAFADVMERYSNETRFERGVDAVGRAFGLVTLLDAWNASLKGTTAFLATTRILQTTEALAKGEKLSERAMTKLSRSGIDSAMAERIAKQAEHWERYGSGISANADAWTDPQARAAFRHALLRDVDHTIITPGFGDAPLWTSSEWGKTVFQFKRFGMASVQRTLVSGLQFRDMQILNGLLLMTALGALGTQLRDWSASTPVPERTTAKWISDSIDRSGVLSMFYELDATMDRFTGGQVSLQSALAGDTATRFKTRGVVEQALGPTAGLAADTQRLVSGLIKGDLTQPDLHKVRRMVPGQNVFYLKFLFDKAEEGVANTFNLPAKDTKSGGKTGRSSPLAGN